MKINRSFLIAAFAIGTTIGAAAQTATPTPTASPTATPLADYPEPPDHPPAPPWLKALDVDGNGIISATEIANATAELLTLDLNKDGVLTPDELHPKPPAGDRGPGPDPRGFGGKHHHGPGGPDGHRPPPPPVIMALDADKDGTLSAAEIKNAPAALLTLDKNGDGQLTIDEIRPPRPPMPPDGGPDDDEPPAPPTE